MITAARNPVHIKISSVGHQHKCHTVIILLLTSDFYITLASVAIFYFGIFIIY